MMFFTVLWGFLTTIVGASQLSFYIGFTGLYLLIFGITKLTSYEQYRTIQTFENKTATKEIEWLVTKRIAIVAAILSFMHLSFNIVLTFFYEETMSYNNWIIYWIGAMSIVNIIVAVVSAIEAGINKSSIFKCIKLIDLSNILISLSMAQRALLFYAGEPNAKLITAIGGVFFSLCAFGVCLLMFRRSRVTRWQFNNIRNQ